MTIALAITALVALLLSSTLRASVAALRQVERHQETTEEIRDAAHFLRRAIGGVPAFGTLDRGRMELFFIGEADRLTLPLETPGGYSLVTILVEQGRLVLRPDTPALAFDPRTVPAAPARTPALLIEGVRELRLAYHDGRAWLAGWPHRDRLPVAVRIEVMRLHGVAFPPQVIALAMGVRT